MQKQTLRNIKITPIAAESLGARSMCTQIETPDTTILLDAGVSLASWRYNLPPHPKEYQIIQQLRENIAKAAQKAQIITISHYHYDHHTPSFTDWVVNWTNRGETAKEIYQNKTVLIKDPEKNINANQQKRADMFQKTAGKLTKQLEIADGKTLRFDKTKLKFSEAVAHGSENPTIGWVIMATVEYDDERFTFAPDVQGPMSPRTTELILAEKPAVLLIGGPPLYLNSSRVNPALIEQGLKNLTQIAAQIPTVILEHHTIRDQMWRQKMNPTLHEATQKGHRIWTAAEFQGQENNFLESKRQQLYEKYPPSEEFKRWTKTLSNKEINRPPL
jgi:predicted metallo-beta-lactamase superfamily hydrolase